MRRSKTSAQRTWGGRFESGPAASVQRFTESVSFDWRLYRQDIAGSIAHARGLARAGLLTRGELAALEKKFRAIERDIAAGTFRWDVALEDVHMNIEAALGPVGRKLHAARSRNDQVATDLRLWVRNARIETVVALRQLMRALVALAEKYREVVMPGYTHLQRAQPVLFAHHLLAYVEMFFRDCQRFVLDINIECPLGSGALAGSTLVLDRHFVARQLQFPAVTQNSMDAVSNRDFILSYLFAAALTGMHLSRLAEDFILWSTAEFGFVRIGDAYTTGSSLMPQKRNPDVCELVRAKTGRLYGNLVALLTVMKALPMSYNRDLQEDKPPLFDSVDTLLGCVRIMTEMVGEVTVHRERCEQAANDPMLLATDLVDYLVKQGRAFRDAHHEVGALVAESERTGTPLPQLVADRLGKEAAAVFDVRRSLAARKAVGAPAPRNVAAQLQRWKRLLAPSGPRRAGKPSARR